MGSGGSIQSAIISLRNNRNLLNKTKFSKDKDILLYSKDKKALQFKTVSPEELDQIKAEIRVKLKKQKLKNTVLIILGMLAVALLCIIFVTI